MRVANVSKVSVMLFCMLFLISMMSGCDIELGRMQDEQMLMKDWESVLNEGTELVAQIEIKYVDALPGEDSYPVESVIITDAQSIQDVFDVFALSNITWESAATDDSSIDSYSSSVRGRDHFSVTFIDAQGNKMKKFNVIDSNIGDYHNSFV